MCNIARCDEVLVPESDYKNARTFVKGWSGSLDMSNTWFGALFKPRRNVQMSLSLVVDDSRFNRSGYIRVKLVSLTPINLRHCAMGGRRQKKTWKTNHQASPTTVPIPIYTRANKSNASLSSVPRTCSHLRSILALTILSMSFVSRLLAQSSVTGALAFMLLNTGSRFGFAEFVRLICLATLR